MSFYFSQKHHNHVKKMYTATKTGLFFAKNRNVRIEKELIDVLGDLIPIDKVRHFLRFKRKMFVKHSPARDAADARMEQSIDSVEPKESDYSLDTLCEYCGMRLDESDYKVEAYSHIKCWQYGMMVIEDEKERRYYEASDRM